MSYFLFFLLFNYTLFLITSFAPQYIFHISISTFILFSLPFILPPFTLHCYSREQAITCNLHVIYQYLKYWLYLWISIWFLFFFNIKWVVNLVFSTKQNEKTQYQLQFSLHLKFPTFTFDSLCLDIKSISIYTIIYTVSHHVMKLLVT